MTTSAQTMLGFARGAFSEGFDQGMREHTSHNGGYGWNESKSKVVLEAALAAQPSALDARTIEALDRARRLFEQAPHLRNNESYMPGASEVRWCDLAVLAAPQEGNTP